MISVLSGKANDKRQWGQNDLILLSNFLLLLLTSNLSSNSFRLITDQRILQWPLDPGLHKILDLSIITYWGLALKAFGSNQATSFRLVS